MNCADAEILICDLVDGTLGPAGRAELERHLAACSACSELARDSAAAVAFMERAADVEPPPELITRILFDPPWAHAARTRPGGLRARLRGFFQPVLQPRFAMGMAMTILSFAMMAKFVKPMRSQWTARDLDPAVVWTALDDRVYRTWQRTVKFYESIRLVYQIQSTLSEWQEQDQEPATAEEPAQQKADERRLPVKNAPPPAADPERSKDAK
jgi:hypothetical protein